MANYKKLLGVLFVVVFAACSPKMRTANNLPKPVDKDSRKPAAKFAEANISLLVPFNLNRFNLKTATKAQVNDANMAIDFYQGVKLGIDSAASLGQNFKLHVFDTRENNLQLATLVKNEALKNSNLVIGPVFPTSIKFIKEVSAANNLLFVSPLAATKPSDFANSKLISIVNNIDQHGAQIANYIAHNFKASETIVVLINTKKTSDEQFALPIKTQFKQTHSSFVVQEYASTYAFETNMIKSKTYAVIVCSANLSFVKSSIDKLYKLKHLKTGGFDIHLFGHPNWLKQNYNVQQLAGLRTILSTSYHIDYKHNAVISFIKLYRAKYNYEPSEYAFKGFDIGFYFGKLIAKYGAAYAAYLTQEKYIGLHNSFVFNYNSDFGYYNTHLMLMQYNNLTLTRID